MRGFNVVFSQPARKQSDKFTVGREPQDLKTGEAARHKTLSVTFHCAGLSGSPHRDTYIQ
jgi:hypothetical protein